MEQHYTIDQPTSQVEHHARRSRFIARVHPAANREQVDEVIRRARESLPGLDHLCFAYRLMSIAEELEEFSTDAGEPNGSAGRPILNTLRQANLVDVAAWVGRYFGGTKLGVPGLATAYAAAVSKSLKGVKALPWMAMVEVQVVMPYSLVDRVKDEVRRVAGIISNEEYCEQVELIITVPHDEVRDFMNRLREWGRGDIQVSGDEIDFGNDHA